MKTQKITVKLLVAVLMIAMLLPCIAACSSGETAPEDFEQSWGNETSNNDSNNNGNQNSNQNNGQNNNQGSAGNNGGDSNKNEDVEINSIGEFHDGLAVIDIKTAGHKYYTNAKGQEVEYKPRGYIDTKGNIVIAPQYTEASNFKNGLARVGMRGKFGYIDTKGNVVVDIVYDSASEYFEDIAIVEKDGVKQYINAEGTVLYTVTGKETALGEVSNGYFYIETKEALISGDEYTMTYYNAKGQKAVVEDAKHGHQIYEAKGEVFGSTCKEGRDLSLLNELGWGVVQSSDGIAQLIWIKNGELVLLYNTKKLIQARYAGILTGPAYAYSDNIFPGIGCFVGYGVTQNIIDVNKSEDIYIDFDNGDYSISTVQSASLDRAFWGRNLGDNYYFIIERYECFDRCRVIMYKNQQKINLEKIPEFSNATPVGVARYKYNDINYFAVLLENKSKTKFISLIDESGNILIKPTSEYNFMYSWKEYSDEYKSKLYTDSADKERLFYSMLPIVDGLICARSSENSLYGYIGLDGEWAIQPKYETATDFYGEGDDAVAVVNNNTIINRKGEIVFTIAE